MERKICTERSQQGLPTSLILLRFDHTTTMVMIVLVVGDDDEGWESLKAQSSPLTSSFAYCI